MEIKRIAKNEYRVVNYKHNTDLVVRLESVKYNNTDGKLARIDISTDTATYCDRFSAFFPSKNGGIKSQIESYVSSLI